MKRSVELRERQKARVESHFADPIFWILQKISSFSGSTSPTPVLLVRAPGEGNA
jgi:hypothetical protein